jgi:hypothetical protein
MAVMVDTQDDVEDGGALVDTDLRPVPRGAWGGEVDAPAARSLARCIAIGLIAARHVGIYRWDGCFAVRDAAEIVAWDRIERVDWAGLPLQSA